MQDTSLEAARETAEPLVLEVLRRVTFAEGLSYLLLLFVAMPLKYLAGIPLAVRIVGGLHGLLFVSFVLALAVARLRRHCSTLDALQLFAASLIPGSLFWLDRRIRAWS